jgi:four helix bundle protein
MEGKVQSYKDLIVWQQSVKLVENIYILTQKFPRGEIYGMVSQIRRAAVSIPANIAEGQARNAKGEYLQFLGVSSGSLAELGTLLLLSKQLKYIDEGTFSNIEKRCDEIGRLLTGLKHALRANLGNRVEGIGNRG